MEFMSKKPPVTRPFNSYVDKFTNFLNSNRTKFNYDEKVALEEAKKDDRNYGCNRRYGTGGYNSNHSIDDDDEYMRKWHGR